MEKLIKAYTIPGIKDIAIDKIEIYCNGEGRYFAKFEKGLNITVPRDSLNETKIKMFKEVFDMLTSEERTPEIEKGLTYLANKFNEVKHTQLKVGGK